MRRRRTTVEELWRSIVGELTPAQSAAVLSCAASSALGVGLRTVRRAGPLRGAVMGFQAFDLVGGLVAFQWPGTRSKYAGGTGRGRLAFPVLHVQPYSVPLAGEGSWTVAAGRHLAAVASTAALDQIEMEPQRRRATANLVAAGLSLCDLAVTDSRQRWFGPVYLFKVVGGHASLMPG